MILTRLGRPVGPHDVAAALRAHPNLVVSEREHQGMRYTAVQLRDEPWEMSVMVEQHPAVAKESAEIAATYAAHHPERERIVACDSRLLLFWNLEDSAEITNLQCLVAEALVQAFGPDAFIFDPESAQFV
jgi:hypothetical protein